jgi:hypothetical protein
MAGTPLRRQLDAQDMLSNNVGISGSLGYRHSRHGTVAFVGLTWRLTSE